MLNKACLLGRIGKKDSKQVKTGDMTTLSIATSKKYTDSSGTKHEDTTWHTVNFFGKLANISAQYAHVGDMIYIEGEINHREVESTNGSKNWRYSINGSQLTFIPKGSPKKQDAPVQEPAGGLVDDDIAF